MTPEWVHCLLHWRCHCSNRRYHLWAKVILHGKTIILELCVLWRFSRSDTKFRNFLERRNLFKIVAPILTCTNTRKLPRACSWITIWRRARERQRLLFLASLKFVLISCSIVYYFSNRYKSFEVEPNLAGYWIMKKSELAQYAGLVRQSDLSREITLRNANAHRRLEGELKHLDEQLHQRLVTVQADIADLKLSHYSSGTRRCKSPARSPVQGRKL